MSPPNSSFKAAPFIREIGRGKKGARDMSQSDARAVYEAMLEHHVSDLELGALLMLPNGLFDQVLRRIRLCPPDTYQEN